VAHHRLQGDALAEEEGCIMPLLPLESFRAIIGLHPAHFWGVAGTNTDALIADESCSPITRQYAWQDTGAVGRHEIAEAIETAETRLREYLGFSVAPRYTTEALAWPAGFDPYGRWQSVQLGEGYVQAVGVESLTAISLAAVVTYSDSDGDLVDDLFTVSAATTVTDVKEVAVYFAAADRFDGADFTDDVGDRWRVQPISITISGGTVTVKGSKWLLVKPIKYEGFTNVGANGLEPTMAANFVTTLDIYRRITNTNGTTAATSQAVIIWESEPLSGACCGATSTAYSGSPYDPAAVAQAVARVGVRDARVGIVTPAEASYDSATGVWASLDWTVCAWPDRVLIRYLAGYPLDSDGQMAHKWRVIVARLAAAELASPICGCADANRALAHWQFDLARTGGAADESYGAISAADLDNPLGTRRGAIYAWRIVKNLRQMRGILA
jgi:hypothetical protein